MAQITYLAVDPKGDNPGELCKPLFLVFLRVANGSGVGNMTEVLVQTLGENVQVLFLEPPTPFGYEFDAWGDVAVGHWDKATGGGLMLEDLGASETPWPLGHLLYVHWHVRSRRSRAHLIDHPVTATSWAH